MKLRSVLAIFAGAALVACAQQPSRTWELPPGVKSLRVNGYDMAYMERGTGAPLVLVHGAMSDFRYFGPSIDTFAKQHRVIAVSLRHYYPEPWDGKGDTFTLQQHANDVAEFIKKLDAGPVHLFGHSRGGTVALHVARDNPQLLRTLILGEGGSTLRAFDANAPAPGQSIGASSASLRARLVLLEQGKLDEAAIDFVNSISGPGAWDAAPDFVKTMVRSNVRTQKGTASEVPGPYECAQVSNLRAPVLLVMGERTSQSYQAITNSLQQCIKHSQRAIVPNAAHVFPRQAPTVFAETLLKFTSQH
jgi:pimeloyl-ACP methyl ester carboxylesterase